ncbi:hypothetical protein EHM92_05645 [bacterium]|nr:MAG: hypothetical protein EHM92_05645 [bacterium]
MGKASILLVVGFGIFFLLSGVNLSSVSVRAYDNAMDYYEGGTARNIAITGANMAANRLFTNPPLINGNPWWPGYLTHIKFQGGYFTATVDSTSSIDPLSGEKRLTMRATGVYRDSTFTVMAIMRQSNFAKFAFFGGMSAANAWWETGDSVFGPSHTQGVMRVTGRPYFGGKVTVKNGVDSSWAGHPNFTAGVETGVNIPLNKSFMKLTQAASANGKVFTGSGDLYLRFMGDSIRWHRQGRPDTTSLLSSFTPNGTITLGTGGNTGNIFVEGVVKGRVTIGALDTTAGARGKVYITGNLTYNTDPTVDPASNDMLGVVAYRDIQIMDNGASMFRVNGSLYSFSAGVTVEHYNTRPPGTFYTLGGWIVENVYPTSNGVALGTAGSKGYKCSVHYDERFRTTSPPYFPTTQAYEILAWYE